MVWLKEEINRENRLEKEGEVEEQRRRERERRERLRTTTFQLSSEMHCRTFLVPVFLQTLRPKYRMLPSCRFFLPDILKLKIVNCK